MRKGHAFRMRRVLIAIDLDDEAGTVLGAARSVAGNDATYRVVHVFRHAATAAVAGSSPPEGREGALNMLRKHAATIPGAEHKLLEGEPAPAILDEADAWRADTIALAPHSKTRIERLLLGSTSERVLRKASTNVLFARRPSRPIERALVCTDLHAPSRVAAQLAARIAAGSGAKLSLLFAAHPAFWGPKSEAAWPPDAIDMDADWLDRAQQEALHAWLATKLHAFNAEHLGGRAEAILREGVPEEVILDAARDHDLVVVGTHGPTAYERAVVGSVAEAVASRASTSVLVAKRQRERL